jgi:DNA-directed RNA polymerase specialized sigma24 family protein
LRKVIAGMSLRAGDAEDVLQTVSVKCFSHAPAYTDRGQCRRWLIRVTTNECITKHRRALRFRRHAASIIERRPRPATNGPVQNAISSHTREPLRDTPRTQYRVAHDENTANHMCRTVAGCSELTPQHPQLTARTN